MKLIPQEFVGIKLEYLFDQHMFAGLTSNPWVLGTIGTNTSLSYGVDGSAVVAAFEPNEAALKHAF